MQSVRVGVHLASLRQPLQTALATAARLGADAVEIDVRQQLRPDAISQTGLRQLRKMLDDMRLRVAAVSFQTRRGYHVAEDLQQRIDATKRAMSFAYELGASVVVNQVGRVPAEPAGAAWELLVASLADIGRHGQKCGAMLAARTGTEDGATLARLIDWLPAGSLSVDFDPGQLIVNGFSASDALGSLAQHIRHIHARDGVQDLAQGRGLEVQLGRGSADFLTIMATMEQLRYDGYYTVQPANVAAPLEEAADAIAYLRNLGRLEQITKIRSREKRVSLEETTADH